MRAADLQRRESNDAGEPVLLQLIPLISSEELHIRLTALHVGRLREAEPIASDLARDEASPVLQLGSVGITLIAHEVAAF